MTQFDSTTYFLQRAAEETESGENSINPVVANLHLEMAIRYRELAAERTRAVPSFSLFDKDRSDRTQEMNRTTRKI